MTNAKLQRKINELVAEKIEYLDDNAMAYQIIGLRNKYFRKGMKKRFEWFNKVFDNLHQLRNDSDIIKRDSDHTIIKKTNHHSKYPKHCPKHYQKYRNKQNNKYLYHR